MASINFFSQDVNYLLSNKRKLRTWISETVSLEGFKLDEMNFIFCDDAYLLEINQKYLNHDTLTDIITFDNSELDKHIVSDIFISIERVKENAKTLKIKTHDEVCRVIIHGTLHLLGYKDKTKTEKSLMTSKEDFYLSRRQE